MAPNPAWTLLLANRPEALTGVTVVQGSDPWSREGTAGPSSGWWDPRAAEPTWQCSSASSELPGGQQVQNAGRAQLSQNPGQ